MSTTPQHPDHERELRKDHSSENLLILKAVLALLVVAAIAYARLYWWSW
ncbi:MAG: hypothetical protein WA966_11150 [Ornithinimicrobium sp.]